MMLSGNIAGFLGSGLPAPIYDNQPSTWTERAEDAIENYLEFASS
jgi:hypothetical protein